MTPREIINDFYAKSKSDPHAKKAWEELKQLLRLPKEEARRIINETYGREWGASK